MSRAVVIPPRQFAPAMTAWLPVVVLGLAIAALVCGDPYLTAFLNFFWLEYFPFTLTAIVFLIMATLAVLTIGHESLWSRKEIIAVTGMFAGAQLIGFNMLKLDPLEIATAPALLLWVTLVLTRRLEPVRVSGNLLMMGGFIFCSVLAAVHAWPVLLAVAVAALMAKFTDYFLLSQFIRTEGVLRTALNAFMVVAVASSVVALLQVGLFLLTGIVFTLSDTGENIFKPTPFGLMLRATGFCPKPQHLSGFLLVALPLLLFRSFEPGLSRWRRGLLFLAVLLTASATVLTLAVGAWITLALVMVLFVYLRWPSRAIHFSVGLILVVMAGYLSGFFEWIYTQYLAHSGILRGGEQRVYLLSLALEKLQRDPLIGVGPRQFAYFTKNFRQFPVHNAYAQAATEAGLVGGLLYIGILAYAGLRLVYLCSTSTSPSGRRFCRMLLLFLLALIWNGMSEPAYDHSNTWVSLGLLEGAILTLRRRGGTATAPAASLTAG